MSVTTLVRSMNQEKMWIAEMSVITVARSMNQEKLWTADSR